MDMIETWVKKAHATHASDLHLEAGVSPALRIAGRLSIQGSPCSGRELVHGIRARLSEEQWLSFHARKSIDVSLLIAKVRCRLNIYQTSRGLALSIRLFRAVTPTIETLNLHPVLISLVRKPAGLILICGATGSGKSSTLAALIQEINLHESKQIITLEKPIEYIIRPKRSLVRQREVGRDTPSFAQGLIDSLRQDPDVILVGEMRTAETMKRTLDAAETGHLVFSTMHSSSCMEAIQRLLSSITDHQRGAVQAQLADCLTAVVCQRLVYCSHAQQRVPECEVLMCNTAVRNSIRTGNIHRLASIMEMGKADGMWTFSLYHEWIQQKRSFSKPRLASAEEEQAQRLISSLPASLQKRQNPRSSPLTETTSADGIIELDDFDEDPQSILARYKKKS